jgi:hypothetical protein
MGTGLLVALAVAVTVGLIGNAVIGLRNTARIDQLNTQLTRTVSASARTRITTVQQRCDLTDHIYNWTLKAHVGPTPSEVKASVEWFLSSYEGCEKQLQTVERIARAAP